MLLEAAVGDSYGRVFEFAPPDFVERNNDALRYYSRSRTSPTDTIFSSESETGRYTDDTQMMLGVAEHILSNDPWTKENLANRFVGVFKRDERTGYASRFYRLLKLVKDGVELLERIKPDSERSGAAMRAPIIGIYPSIDDVLEKTALQASITHNTRSAIRAAQASSLSLHYFAYKLGKKAHLGEFIEDTLKSPGWRMPYTGSVGLFGWMSVRAAITALMENDSTTALLKHCISFTGDVDTVATIAMASASVCWEIEQNISSELVTRLESGAYGIYYIAGLDFKLHQRLHNFVVSQ